MRHFILAKVPACLCLLSILCGDLPRLVAASARTSETANKDIDDAVVKLEPFVVTGTRIKRIEADGPQPVTRFTIADIQASDSLSFADFMQNLPYVSGANVSMIQVDKPYRGMDSMNLRGLGGGRYLPLIDGRRAAPYALTVGGASYFDVDSIPLEAIESVEYLKDGASAIYGSDAIAGVMNIKLKREYSGLITGKSSGLTTSVTVGNTIGHDTFTRGVSLLAGGGNGKRSHVVLSASWLRQNSNVMSDYDRSKSGDFTSLGAKGTNFNSTANYPANLYLYASQASPTGLSAGYYAIQGGTPTANPTTSMFTRYTSSSLFPNENRYDWASDYQLLPDTERRSVYANWSHEITQNLTMFTRLLHSDKNINYSWTPPPANSSNVLTSANTYLKIPRTNPYNPFQSDLTVFYYRTNFGPSRGYDITSRSTTGITGLEGKAGGDWTWETVVSMSRNAVTMLGRNFVNADSLQAALSGTTRATALNPFGPSDNQALVDSLFVDSYNRATTTAKSGDFSASGTLCRMPGLFGQASPGSIGLAFGCEVRGERIDSNPDTASYIGTSGGQPFAGSRTVQAGFLELKTPVLRRALEFQWAARYERSSDFGESTNPKFGCMIQPLSWLKLRGSYSQSFKAPDLGFLYATRTTSYTTSAVDPLRPQDGARQYRIVTGGNPDLQPEKGKAWYGGLNFDFGRPAHGVGLSVDYFSFTIDQAIISYTTPSYFFAYFPERITRDNSQGTPGPITQIDATYDNVLAYYYRGLDLELDYRLHQTRLGDFDLIAKATRINYYGYDSGLGTGPINYAGRYNLPRWTGNAQIRWRLRDFGAGVAAIYKGPYFNQNYTTAGWGENPITKINAHISYSGFRGFRITLSVDNVFDTQPPVNGREYTGFDQNTYAAWSLGRFVTLRVDKEF